MDYYEELALSRTATVPEIRRAYKVLARLLHPDGQAEEDLRAVAQRQMQRLNEILETLTSPASRRDYDAGLEDAHGRVTSEIGAGRATFVLAPYGARRPPNRGPGNEGGRPLSVPLPEWAQLVVRHWFWTSLFLMLACMAIWFKTQQRAQSMLTTHPAAGEKARQQRPEVRTLASSMRPGVRVDEAARVGGLFTESAGLGTALPAVDVPLDSAHPAAETPQAGRTIVEGTKADALLFAGTWLYVADSGERAHPGNHPLVYAQLSMEAEHGRLAGRYRARYQLPAPTVSPDVVVRVQGDLPTGTTARLTWTSAQGATGEMEISLFGPKLMNLMWWSTHSGQPPALTSGTATLIGQEMR